MEGYEENAVLTFWNKHKEAIICVAAGLLIYRAGYKTGCRQTIRAVEKCLLDVKRAVEEVAHV